MDNTTLLIIILVVLFLFGGGWYGRGCLVLNTRTAPPEVRPFPRKLEPYLFWLLAAVLTAADRRY